jgi:peptide/nickel transport system substrate-binding protein
MFAHKKLAILVVLVMIAPLVLSACGPTPAPQTIIQTVPVEVTKIVEVAGTPQTVVETVQVEVTAAPEATPAPGEVKFVAPDPTTYTFVTFGDIDTMDPNLAYDTASAAPMLNVMEGLIFFNRENMTQYIPVLATEVPSVENGGISADGKTYTFKIRQGVKFHNGKALSPEDVIASLQRVKDIGAYKWSMVEVTDVALAGGEGGLPPNSYFAKLMVEMVTAGKPPEPRADDLG